MTKCSKDPSHAIFLKSWEFKDIRYDAYNDKDNDQEKDNDNEKKTLIPYPAPDWEYSFTFY